MEIKRLKERLEDYKSALERLKESLDLELNSSIVLDAVIKRFEFTYEIAWKTLKIYLEFNGILDARTPRDSFKEGFSAGIIEDGEAWINMMLDRNLTSHTYNESTAHEIYHRIKTTHFYNLKKLFDSISKEVSV